MARSWLIRLDDMLHAIETIESLIPKNLQSDVVLRLAFERSFEILSEASRHIPLKIKQDHPGTRWQDLADLGNILRHRYHKVSIERLLETAREDIPPLKAVLLLMKDL